MRATLTTAPRSRWLLLLGVLAVFVLATGLAACGGDDDSGDSGSTTPAETTAPSGDTPQSASTEEGAQIFKDVGCASCHTMKAAGSQGVVGPNLDEVKPTLQQTVKQVENGGGAMPPYKDRLSSEQIQAVSQYVVTSTGG